MKANATVLWWNRAKGYGEAQWNDSRVTVFLLQDFQVIHGDSVFLQAKRARYDGGFIKYCDLIATVCKKEKA